MTIIDTTHYTYRVSWSPEDAEYVATCLELPSLSWLAPSPTAALSGIEQVAAEAVADLTSNSEPVPDPLAERSYSGRFVVRIPPGLHRELVAEAAQEGLSLNRLVSDRLARH